MYTSKPQGSAHCFAPVPPSASPGLPDQLSEARRLGSTSSQL